jgi:hypothetical protein
MKDIGDVRSSSTAGKKGSNYRRQKIVQSAKGLITITTPPTGFASMIEGLQLGITVNSAVNGSQFIIGWGEGQRPRSAGGKASVHDRLGG